MQIFENLTVLTKPSNDRVEKISSKKLFKKIIKRFQLPALDEFFVGPAESVEFWKMCRIDPRFEKNPGA